MVVYKNLKTNHKVFNLDYITLLNSKCTSFEYSIVKTHFKFFELITINIL